MVDQGGDAQCRGRQSDAAWSAGDPGRHLHRLSAGRLLGRMGRGLGLYPAEFPDRRCARRALRAFWRAVLTAVFYGVSPAVIALILHSCYRLAKLGMEDWLQW